MLHRGLMGGCLISVVSRLPQIFLFNHAGQDWMSCMGRDQEGGFGVY